MGKNRQRRLILHKETLRTLVGEELRQAGGGYIGACSGIQSTCSTNTAKCGDWRQR